MRKPLPLFAAAACAALCCPARADLYTHLQGVVHDAQHHPIRSARITLRAAHSDLAFHAVTGSDGQSTLPQLPLGEYLVIVTSAGFADQQENITLASGTAPVLHFELVPATVHESVSVHSFADSANSSSATTTTLIGREDIAETPGADRANSLALITDYTPGAYMTHDMLHIRGGHQTSWLVDGVEIPNTNIGSNLAAQVDPRDIDYLEVQRGSYGAENGDRTYAVFNVVPRSGFERDREAELVLTAGNFLQTDDQLNFGDHSAKAAYYASLSGSRSDYGLAPPVAQTRHDQTASTSAFLSLIDNATASDQLRSVLQFRHDFFQVPYDPDPASLGNSQFDSSGLRDTQSENDGLATFTWSHTFNPANVVQLSPFVHVNAAGYHPGVADDPVATTSDRTSAYAGGQLSYVASLLHSTVEAGLYGFGQHDSDTLATKESGGGGVPSISEGISGSVVEPYVSGTVHATKWLTLIPGLRFTRFSGSFGQTYVAPRIGAAVRVPRLNWVFRGFYGRFYQPPPLLTTAGPLVAYATANNTGFAPLHGERDEEQQFGVQIPWRGWLLDADTFRTRVNNVLDHSNIGESSLYFPVSVDGALVRAWELTLRSPGTWRFGQFHLAYSNQIAEQRGGLTGGLICTPVGNPACDASFSYRPVDHDQRNTLSAGFNARLPHAVHASANVSYGSGFTNGQYDPTQPPVDPRYPYSYLPQHTSVDVSAGKTFGQRFTASVTAVNLLNSRTLLDNSLTFGGFHWSDPRQVYAEVRYRFRY